MFTSSTSPKECLKVGSSIAVGTSTRPMPSFTAMKTLITADIIFFRAIASQMTRFPTVVTLAIFNQFRLTIPSKMSGFTTVVTRFLRQWLWTIATNVTFCTAIVTSFRRKSAWTVTFHVPTFSTVEAIARTSICSTATSSLRAKSCNVSGISTCMAFS